MLEGTWAVTWQNKRKQQPNNGQFLENYHATHVHQSASGQIITASCHVHDVIVLPYDVLFIHYISTR
jgi:hypothetical protein